MVGDGGCAGIFSSVAVVAGPSFYREEGIVEWMEIKITVPADEGSALLPRFREMTDLNQIDEDWTVEKRKRDNALMEFHPCPEPPDRKADW